MPSPFFNKTYFPKIRVKVTLIDILKVCGLGRMIVMIKWFKSINQISTKNIDLHD